MAKLRIAVVGAGLMGHGIAQVFALAGHDVAITDAHAPTLANAKARILTNLGEMGDDVKAVERMRVCVGTCGGRGGRGLHRRGGARGISPSSSGCSPTSNAPLVPLRSSPATPQ